MFSCCSIFLFYRPILLFLAIRATSTFLVDLGSALALIYEVGNHPVLLVTTFVPRVHPFAPCESKRSFCPSRIQI